MTKFFMYSKPELDILSLVSNRKIISRGTSTGHAIDIQKSLDKGVTYAYFATDLTLTVLSSSYLVTWSQLGSRLLVVSCDNNHSWSLVVAGVQKKKFELEKSDALDHLVVSCLSNSNSIIRQRDNPLPFVFIIVCSTTIGWLTTIGRLLPVIAICIPRTIMF